ncbi:hypothetical protein, partial [Pseudomonas sp. S4_EA_1b]|uniref:hypothetical protein n=1 Tax=Pseudomonas sp. S4_EA_1b TaxID=2796960 RepID=UPI001E345EA6
HHKSPAHHKKVPSPQEPRSPQKAPFTITSLINRKGIAAYGQLAGLQASKSGYIWSSTDRRSSLISG